MMEGVVQRGTGAIIRQILPNVPMAGKTGTTNDEKDAWFVGYTPDLVVGVFIGYDTPRPMGKGMTGGHVAAPIFAHFMKAALGRQARGAVPNSAGDQAGAREPANGAQGARRGRDCDAEAFKPNEEPDDAYSIIGFTNESGTFVNPRSGRAAAQPEHRAAACTDATSRRFGCASRRLQRRAAPLYQSRFR